MSDSSLLAVQKRLAQVRAKMRDNGLDAFLVTAPENRQYVTGFFSLDAEAGSVLITPNRVVLLTDDRYSEQAREEAPDCTVDATRDDLDKRVSAFLKQFGWKNPSGAAKPVLGIEAEHLAVSQYEALRRRGRGLYAVKPVSDVILHLRAVKDKEEIALTRRATEITEQTFTHILEYLRQPDLTEQQVAAEILTTFLRLGADGVAFDSIVAGGPMGARTHATPGNRRLEPGQPIVIDMGARYHGYCADMTRTVFLDDVPPVWAERYQAVLAANEACERGLRAGMTGRAGDELARATMRATGWPLYAHGTGHGTGLNIHEEPRLSARAPEDAILPEGAIVTVEPGLYLSGEGGIRIEDAVLITKRGCEVLTHAPKDLDAMIVHRQKAAARRPA